MELLYTTTPGGMRVADALLGLSLLGSVVILAALLLTADTATALIVGLLLIPTFAFIFFILPRRYEVWDDHLALVFPLWRWRVSYDSLDVVRDAESWEPYAFLGYRFATAPSQAVTILRRNSSLFRRPNLVISPHDRAEFLRHVRRAMGR